MKPRCRLVAMDYQSHPDKSVADCVRESCSIPFFFEAVAGTGAERGQLFVDGGILLNYPIRLLYKYLAPESCMGFYITSTDDAAGEDDSIELKPIGGMVEFIESIANTWRNLAMKQHINPDDWARTCKSEINISATKFDLVDVEKDDLIKRGEIGMDNFLNYLEKL
jgi:predicted acylesterase/phospholipase RssA